MVTPELILKLVELVGVSGLVFVIWIITQKSFDKVLSGIQQQNLVMFNEMQKQNEKMFSEIKEQHNFFFKNILENQRDQHTRNFELLKEILENNKLFTATIACLDTKADSSKKAIVDIFGLLRNIESEASKLGVKIDANQFCPMMKNRNIK